MMIQASGQFVGDVAWTCEAITNIVKNCMEHTPEGGVIRIEALENPLYREIVIADTGSGIAAEDLPHIFERFYKGKAADGNSFGVGLALSRMIVVGQGGTLKAENRRTGGACFTLRFYKSVV
jgi:signal transduction histidine kinase